MFWFIRLTHIHIRMNVLLNFVKRLEYMCEAIVSEIKQALDAANAPSNDVLLGKSTI